MRQVCLAFVCALPLVTAVLPASADEAEELLHKYSFCLVCHGYEGQGNTTVQAPALAGIEPWYLVAALDSYRSGQRHTATTAMEMQSAARMIGPADYDEIHTFISALASVPQDEPAAPADQAERGAEAYAQYCALCHGSEAEGNSQLAAPGLKRLNRWYLSATWESYLAGGRGDDDASPAARQMRQMALAVPADIAIEDVIAFITE